MAGADMILCDTNILIEFYKGRADVVDTLRGIGSDELAASVVTMGELFFGARDKRELRKIQKHLSMICQFPLDLEISALFLSLLEKYALSHKLSVPDALIAATAIRHNLPLYHSM
jgi:predicted nucleic acid-binding protein